MIVYIHIQVVSFLSQNLCQRRTCIKLYYTTG